jgi:DNA repair protein RecO (recombination protein O)
MSIRTHALVIRADKDGEADRLLTLFTKEIGKVRALARSADKPKSRWAGSVLPFAEIEADLYAKREGASRYALTQCQVVDAHAGLRTSLLGMGVAAALCETVDSLVPERENLPDLWEMAREALHWIETGENKTSVLLAFTLSLLGRLGVGPNLNACVRCGLPYPTGKPARWSGKEGGLVCRKCVTPGDEAKQVSAKGMALVLSSAEGSLSAAAGSQSNAKEIRGILQTLYNHTEFHLDWRPKTLSWLDSVT